MKLGRAGKVRKRRGLLVVHTGVERYHRRVGTLLSDPAVTSFLTAVILFLSALPAEGTVREAFLAAGDPDGGVLRPPHGLDGNRG